MIHKKALSENGRSGFSLVEVVVVVAIMAVLGITVAPQFLHYVSQNRATACKVDREGILAVYERCIYEETKGLVTADLQAVMDAADPATEHEIKQFDKCPSGGHYTATVVGDVASITCDCTGHEAVMVDFSLWNGTELAEGIDNPYEEPPTPPQENDEEESTEEPPDEEVKPATGGVWPYDDDPRWDGKRYPGQVVEIPVPTPLFTSKDGVDYVVVSRNGATTFPVYWEWNRGPENIDQGNASWEAAVRYLGVTITDINTVLHPSDPNYITGVNYGDILLYKGYKYIYGSHDLSYYKPFPIEGQNGNNFYLIGSETKEE